MPFDKVIIDLHWNKKRSINSISKQCGVSHTAILRLCRLTSLKTRTHKEASSLNMNLKNPSHCLNARNARAKTISKVFKIKELPQEEMFRKILTKMKIKFETQKAIGGYNIDFFLPDKNLCIEIDSTYKWGMDRKKAAAFRDKYILSKGYKTIRLNKVWMNDLLNLIEVLYA